MSSSFGTIVKVSVFGQSHSAGIGAVVEGLPPGEPIDMEKVRQFMRRRAPGNAAHSTRRTSRRCSPALWTARHAARR